MLSVAQTMQRRLLRLLLLLLLSAGMAVASYPDEKEICIEDLHDSHQLACAAQQTCRCSSSKPGIVTFAAAATAERSSGATRSAACMREHAVNPPAAI